MSRLFSSSFLAAALLASGGAITAPATAGAQEQPAAQDPGATDTATDEPQASEHDEIVVEDTLPYLPESNTIATKLPLPLADTPASVGVVTAPVIEEQRGVVLGDALRNVSGLNVQTGNGVFDFFVVRGLDSISGAMILTDGAREPESSFYQLYNIDRVEVLKGPSSFLYGASPLAGTVNLVRKQPLPMDFGRVAVTGGSYSTLEGLVDWNAANQDGSLAFRLGAIYRESDEYRDDKASELAGFNPSLTWTPNDRTRINFNLELVGGEYRSDAGLPLIGGTQVPEVPRTRSYQSPFDISDQDVTRLQVDYERQVGAEGTLRTKLYYRELDWLSKATLFNGVFPNATGGLDVSRFLAELDSDQRFYGGQLEYLTSAETGAVKHDLMFGLEITQIDDVFSFVPQLLPAIDLFAPVETAEQPLFPIPGQSQAGDADTFGIAPYVIDQMSLSDRVLVLLGARWDSLDFEEAVLGTERDDSELSPLVGLVFKATGNVSIYANAGAAFAPPSTFGLEEDRVPEDSTQYELGVKAALSDGVDATFALYQLERENIAIPDQSGVNRQTGDQEARGLEIELSARLGRGGRLLAAYAYTDGELTTFTESVLVGFFPPTFATLDLSGNTPAFTPEHLFNVWFSQSWDSGLGLGAGGRYVSEQFIAENNLFEIEDYWVFDASAFYSLADWRLNLFVKNLFGEEYLTRGFGAASVIPAPETSAYLTLEYAF
jgi:TonB-dependent siderophore receptor